MSTCAGFCAHGLGTDGERQWRGVRSHCSHAPRHSIPLDTSFLPPVRSPTTTSSLVLLSRALLYLPATYLHRASYTRPAIPPKRASFKATDSRRVVPCLSEAPTQPPTRLNTACGENRKQTARHIAFSQILREATIRPHLHK